jgi:hypothetical protein
VRVVRNIGLVGSLGALVLAGCGGGSSDARGPEDQVRDAAAAYLSALEKGSWARACRMMTAGARADLGRTGGSCARTLERGAGLNGEERATAAREVPGARVRVSGATATIGPLGAFPEPLRLKRVGGSWLVAG